MRGTGQDASIPSSKLRRNLRIGQIWFLRCPPRLRYSRNFSLTIQHKSNLNVPSALTTRQPLWALLLVSAFVMCLPRHSHSQVNIEKMRIEDPEGFSFSLSSNFALRTGNLKRYDLGLNTRLDYKKGRRHIFVLGNIGYGESRNQTYKNRSFAHIRFMHEVSKILTSEIFGQIENDEFTLLQIRVLGGVGFRMPYVKKENIAIYQGTSLMFEHERLDIDRVSDHQASLTSNRWNNYLNIRLRINDTVSFFTTGYYQPRFDDFGDYRILTDGGLRFDFSKHFAFTTNLNLRYDSRPPNDLEPLDLSISNGILIQF